MVENILYLSYIVFELYTPHETLPVQVTLKGHPTNL